MKKKRTRLQLSLTISASIWTTIWDWENHLALDAKRVKHFTNGILRSVLLQCKIGSPS